MKRKKSPAKVRSRSSAPGRMVRGQAPRKRLPHSAAPGRMARGRVPRKARKSRRGSARRVSAPAGLTKAKTASIRKHLLEMREDLMRTVRNQQVSEGDSGDSVDQASQSIEKELLFELSDNERVTLDQIEAALRKIEKGNYGLCESCQKPISRQRLEALPFARYCISCQSSMESASPELIDQTPDFRGIVEEPSREV